MNDRLPLAKPFNKNFVFNNIFEPKPSKVNLLFNLNKILKNIFLFIK